MADILAVPAEKRIDVSIPSYPSFSDRLVVTEREGGILLYVRDADVAITRTHVVIAGNAQTALGDRYGVLALPNVSAYTSNAATLPAIANDPAFALVGSRQDLTRTAALVFMEEINRRSNLDLSGELEIVPSETGTTARLTVNVPEALLEDTDRRISLEMDTHQAVRERNPELAGLLSIQYSDRHGDS